MKRRLVGPERLAERIALTVDISPLGEPAVVANFDELLSGGYGDYFGWDSDFHVDGQESPMDPNVILDLSTREFQDLLGLDYSDSFAGSENGSFIASSNRTAKFFNASGDQINSFEVPDGTMLDVAKSADTAIAVWRASGQIHAQLFDAAGFPILSEPLTLGVGGEAAVDMSSDGKFVVAWQSNDEFQPGVVGQSFDALGSPVGHQFQVGYLGDEIEEWRPQVAMDDSGNFVVAWDGWIPEIHGHMPPQLQRFDSHGNTIGAVITFDDLAFTLSDIDMDSSGNFVLVWPNHDGLNIQAFTPELEPTTSAIIELGNEYASDVQVVLDEVGKFLVIRKHRDDAWFHEYETSLVPTEPFSGLATNTNDFVEVQIGRWSYSVSTNGGEAVVIPISDGQPLELDGRDGQDSLLIVGSGLDERVFADGDTGQVTVRTGENELLATGFERVTIDGGGGKDSAQLYGSTSLRKRDRLFGYPTDTGGTVMHAGSTDPTRAAQADYIFEVQNFARIDSFGRGGWDYATLFGTNDNDHFYRFTDYEVLIANGMIQKTKDFERVDVYGRYGNDSAHLTDTAGDDKFFSFPEFSVLLLGEADKDRLKVHGFEHLHVNSRNGGTDTAYLSRVQSSDALFAIPEIVWMTRASRFETVLGFDAFRASPDEDETPFLSIFDGVENFIAMGTWIHLV